MGVTCDKQMHDDPKPAALLITFYCSVGQDLRQCCHRFDLLVLSICYTSDCFKGTAFCKNGPMRAMVSIRPVFFCKLHLRMTISLVALNIFEWELKIFFIFAMIRQGRIQHLG